MDKKKLICYCIWSFITGGNFSNTIATLNDFSFLTVLSGLAALFGLFLVIGGIYFEKDDE